MRQGPRPGFESKKTFAIEIGKMWDEFKDKYGDEKRWEDYDAATLEEMKTRVSELIAKCNEQLARDHTILEKKKSNIAVGWRDGVLNQAMRIIEQKIIEKTP